MVPEGGETTMVTITVTSGNKTIRGRLKSNISWENGDAVLHGCGRGRRVGTFSVYSLWNPMTCIHDTVSTIHSKFELVLLLFRKFRKPFHVIEVGLSQGDWEFGEGSNVETISVNGL
eukprot:1326289-Amorphochlora_amoeboformis.AAC.1